MDKKIAELEYTRGNRQHAIKQALAFVKEHGRPCQLVICKDISGEHTGDLDCFCAPLILDVYPEDLE